MDSEKSEIINNEENDTRIFKKIVGVVLTILFVVSLLFWFPYLVMIIFALASGGMKGVIFAATYLAYPIWAGMGLVSLWKNIPVTKGYQIFSIVFLIGIALSFFA